MPALKYNPNYTIDIVGVVTYEVIFAIWFIRFYLEIEAIEEGKHIQCDVQEIRQVEVIPPHLQSKCLSEFHQLSHQVQVPDFLQKAK